MVKDRAWNLICEHRIDVLIISIVLLSVYLVFTFFVRPVNPISFLGVEDRLLAGFLSFFILSIILYIPEILLFSHKFFLRFKLSKLIPNTFIDKLHIPAFVSNSVFIQPFSSLYVCAKACYEKMRKLKSSIPAFVYIGLAIFLVLLPLVLSNASELIEPIVLVFIGYAVFSYKFHLDERAMIVAALLFLLSCPILLILEEDSIAEISAIFAYYSLCAGVLLQFVDYVKDGWGGRKITSHRKSCSVTEQALITSSVNGK